eukprot:scaffold9519_cov128-Isochrysis_galbana.AAC.3
MLTTLCLVWEAAACALATPPPLTTLERAPTPAPAEEQHAVGHHRRGQQQPNELAATARFAALGGSLATLGADSGLHRVERREELAMLRLERALLRLGQPQRLLRLRQRGGGGSPHRQAGRRCGGDGGEAERWPSFTDDDRGIEPSPLVLAGDDPEPVPERRRVGVVPEAIKKKRVLGDALREEALVAAAAGVVGRDLQRVAGVPRERAHQHVLDDVVAARPQLGPQDQQRALLVEEAVGAVVDDDVNLGRQADLGELLRVGRVRVQREVHSRVRPHGPIVLAPELALVLHQPIGRAARLRTKCNLLRRLDVNRVDVRLREVREP